MNLEERIARLIDPEAWRLLDQHREAHHDPYERPPSRFTIESRDAASRVIDGLNLDGRRHRYDLSGFIREDE